MFQPGKCNFVFLKHIPGLSSKMYKTVQGVSWIILCCSIFYTWI